MEISSPKQTFGNLTEKATNDVLSTDEEDFLAGYRKVGASKKVNI
jgi:hypothetical protein